MEFDAVITAAVLEIDAAVTVAPEIVTVVLEIDAAIAVALEINVAVAVALEVVGGKL